MGQDYNEKNADGDSTGFLVIKLFDPRDTRSYIHQWYQGEDGAREIPLACSESLHMMKVSRIS